LSASVAVAELFDPAVLTTADHERLQYVVCNAIGHAWFYTDADWQSTIGVPVTLRCERCGSLRREAINRLGKAQGRRYIHPYGYKYPRGSKPSKDEFRVLALVSLINEQRKKRQL
jgi:hypothetical protein